MAVAVVRPDPSFPPPWLPFPLLVARTLPCSHLCAGTHVEVGVVKIVCRRHRPCRCRGARQPARAAPWRCPDLRSSPCESPVSTRLRHRRVRPGRVRPGRSSPRRADVPRPASSFAVRVGQVETAQRRSILAAPPSPSDSSRNRRKTPSSSSPPAPSACRCSRRRPGVRMHVHDELQHLPTSAAPPQSTLRFPSAVSGCNPW
jgi:hypothetical protein